MSDKSRFLDPAHRFEPSISHNSTSKMKELVIFEHHNGNHWITLHCKWKPNAVVVYNSMHKGKETLLSEDLRVKIGKYYQYQKYTVECAMNIQQQIDVHNCGLFSIMFAQCLYRGEDPRNYRFEVEGSRNHLLDGLLRNDLRVFPRSTLDR